MKGLLGRIGFLLIVVGLVQFGYALCLRKLEKSEDGLLFVPRRGGTDRT